VEKHKVRHRIRKGALLEALASQFHKWFTESEKKNCGDDAGDVSLIGETSSENEHLGILYSWPEAGYSWIIVQTAAPLYFQWNGTVEVSLFSYEC